MNLPHTSKREKLKKIILIIILLYLFLFSISLMGKSLKLFGKGFSENLIRTTSNPAVGLMIGLLATAVIQSSSTTTSIIVGFVAGGVLEIRDAIPIIMGANMGTTVTSFLVSFFCITRKEEFEKAISVAAIHDIFKVLIVIIIFPLEMTTHFLEKTAIYITGFLGAFGQDASFKSPVKAVVQPCVGFFCDTSNQIFGEHIIGKILLLLLSLVIVFISLFFLVKVMKSLVLSKTEVVFHKIVGRSALLGMFIWMLFTALVQSSSVTVSILVPIVAAGIITLDEAFPLTLGADVGTTITAILASMSGDCIDGLTIALVHLLFNVTGILIIYPSKYTRSVPIYLAKKMGQLAVKSKWYPVTFILFVYFLIPGLLIFVFK